MLLLNVVPEQRLPEPYLNQVHAMETCTNESALGKVNANTPRWLFSCQYRQCGRSTFITNSRPLVGVCS